MGGVRYGACVFAVRRLLGCTEDALRQTCSVVLLLPLLLRNALVRSGGDVQYGAYLSVVRRLFRCAEIHCGRVVPLCFSFRCCCAMRFVGAQLENILFCRMEKAFFFFFSAQHPCSTPAPRAAAAEGDALYFRFFAPAPLQKEIIDQQSKPCTVPHHSQAPHQRRRGRRRSVESSLHQSL